MNCECCADLAVRAARAEIERDKALEQARILGEAYRAWTSGDKEKILDTLHIIGMPARDLADIYRLEADWRKHGGSNALLERLREIDTLRKRVAELEAA